MRRLVGALRPASPPAAAIQPAWRPITSSTNTLVEVRAIEAHVERGLARRDRDVLGDRAEAGAAVGVRQVVVDGLGDAEAGDRIAERAPICETFSAVSIESLPPL